MPEKLEHRMPVAFKIDRELSAIGDAFDFLLYVTPANTGEAWRQFQHGGYRQQPDFKYLPLRFDPDRLKSELYRLPIEEVESPILAQIMRDKQEELDLQISMLRHRQGRRFFYGSLQLYGEPDDELKRLSRLVLEQLGDPPAGEDAQASDESEGDTSVSGEDMVRHARREVERYQERSAVFASAEVEACGEECASLTVCRNRLRVPVANRFDRNRVEPLLHHEVGTHMLTYFNGRQQPLKMLAAGLAEYESTQEGLAVLAEHLVGGLTRARLCLLAARVLTAAGLVEREPFEAAYAMLVEELGFAERSAFGIAMRVYRGGGLTKDMIYLRGLQRVCGYLENDGDLELLLVGKVALENVAALQGLSDDGLVVEPAVLPRYLEQPEVQEKLDEIRRGISVLELAREVIS